MTAGAIQPSPGTFSPGHGFGTVGAPFDPPAIARDLHDLAIQGLFATGMTLQSAGQFITHPEASERVMRAVDDLDGTIKIIRSAIFGLRVRDRDAIGSGLRAEVVRVAGEATSELGFTPGVRTEACSTPTCRKRSPTMSWPCSSRPWPMSPGTPVPAGPRWS